MRDTGHADAAVSEALRCTPACGDAKVAAAAQDNIMMTIKATRGVRRS
jgi:hypothetical protein